MHFKILMIYEFGNCQAMAAVTKAEGSTNSLTYLYARRIEECMPVPMPSRYPVVSNSINFLMTSRKEERLIHLPPLYSSFIGLIINIRTLIARTNI